MEKFYINGSSSDKIACYIYKKTIEQTKGIVYFAHGVTEYAERHSKLFEILNSNGFDVITNDHMGHGDSINGKPMYFQSSEIERGWNCACLDSANVISTGKKFLDRDENTPVYAIGFSLGSFIVRTLAIRYPDLFNSVVLLGTGDQSKAITKLCQFIASNESDKHGAENETELITKLTFGTYNKKFNGKTRADWLCENNDALEKYLEDKKCGHGFTAGLFMELSYGMEFTGDKKNLAKLNKNTRWLMLSGKDDPVGDFSKGVVRFSKKLNKLGICNKYKFFDNMRHDILHEKYYDEVHEEIVKFLS